MVKPFQFARIPKIIFRAGAITDLPGIVRKYGNSVLVVTGEKSFLNSGQAINLFEALKLQGTEYHQLTIPSEPTPQMIDKAVDLFAGKKTDLIISIGGGSVIDAGKAISAMMYMKESVTVFLEGVGGKEHPGTKIPFIAIPTTSGTGSEATKNAVISQVGENGFKRSLRHDNFVPDIALLDPELTLNCPAEITAASGMDCFTQLTEAFLSDKATEFTDALALEGLKQIKVSLIGSFLNGKNLEARTGMSFAALTSGICLANAGLGVVHGFASSIGGRYNIPHGVICGTLMAPSNELNVSRLRETSQNPGALKKYALLGELFHGKPGNSDGYYIDFFIDYLNKLTSDLNLPGLKKLGIKEEALEILSLKTEIKNNPVKLAVSDLAGILRKRLA
jgi:alcohol dehydrogenase class IV